MLDENRGAQATTFDQLIDTLPDGVVVTTPSGQIVAVNRQFCALSGHARADLVDAPIESLIPSRVRAQHVALRSAYIADGGPTRAMSDRLDIVLLRADGFELPVDVSLSTFGTGSEQLVVAAVRDASVRRRAELEIEQERAFSTAMHTISAALLRGGTIEETLRTISSHARSLLDADLAALAVPADDDPETLVFRVCEGHGADALEGSTVRADASLSGAVMREQEPALLTDASTDPRFHRPAAWPDGMGPALFVPLHARDDTLGSLIVAKRRGRPMFRVNDVLLMSTFAAQAALALTDARAQDALRGLRVLEDRDRVAAAMRDTVVSRVSGASLTLHTVLQGDLAEALQDRVWQAIEELDAAVAAIRAAVFPR
ncbi:MAG TPA: PAS domain S-box protein [Acidimicrobiia bacterium]|nr:PAS domain S-box protein [Acidimicrobiia bacterium]